MKNKKMSQFNIPSKLNPLVGITIQKLLKNNKINKGQEVENLLLELSEMPENFLNHEELSEVASKIIENQPTSYVERAERAPYKQWGSNIEHEAIKQIENACMLPISVRGALMPDAHTGYGLPIGGVLATENAIIPYAVGVDIACTMKLSIYDISPIIIDQEPKRFYRTLREETKFGEDIFEHRRVHSVLDEDWNITEITKQYKDKAWKQLGTSGSGNHFVEFGIITITEKNQLGLEPRQYLALLSHSGSRGVGAKIANFYSKLAKERSPQLPKGLKDLAYFTLDSHEGQEYWNAMQLMGKYAQANHDCIHKYIAKVLGYDIVKSIENHHNFAWIEEYNGKPLVVHRKGATPAGIGTLGIIPGSMATSAYVVSGLGNSDSLNSASHGAGRRMSRTAAREQFDKTQLEEVLLQNNVKLLSGGIDESPMAYKDINEVMSAQSDLVIPLAEFKPRIVIMAEDSGPRNKRRR